MNEKGFTLTELIIVLAIIGVLAAIAIPAYIGQQRGAVRTEAYANLEALRLLEEQFFAERGLYAASAGNAGNTTAIRDANLALIQALLPGFQPGGAAQFSYRVLQNNQLNVPVANPPAWAASPANTLCFTAVATGLVNTRIAGEIYAIDCFNNKNF